MALLLLTKYRSRYEKVIVVFANTGQENEETLEFVNRCDKAFNLNTFWIEGEPQRGRSKVTHRIVSYETASRNGEPFEKYIKLYGIPNAGAPDCTRELKTRPMKSFLRSAGFVNFDMAIGFRADEKSRTSKNRGNAIYPLIDWEPTTKPQINKFWRDQPFRLNLAGYQGNCITCWKKSTRKLLTIMDENPTAFDFFERMERENCLVGAEFSKKHIEGYKRSFFRNNLTVVDLRNMLVETDWQRAENDAIIYNDIPVQLDLDAGCVESCEIDFGQLAKG